MKQPLIKLTLMVAGYCTLPEFMTLKGGQRQSVPFPATFALLEHPTQGPILFDSGYTARFFTETQDFPYKLYAKITPVYMAEAQTARDQLKAKGIAAEDIRQLIISHFHADHIAGVADFPKANYIYFDTAYNALRHKKGFAALRAGFLAGLLPSDFEQRSLPIKETLPAAKHNTLHFEKENAHDIHSTKYVALPPQYTPFKQGVDLLGDQSLIAVSLPGHAFGQMGLFLQAEGLGPTFLAADACWHSKAYRELIWPHPVTNLILADPKAYRETLTKLHQLHKNNPNLLIIPSHCREVLQEINLSQN